MDTQDELLSLLDLLNLDEEVIDSPLKQLMQRNNHSNKHLKSAIQLLRYKLLINAQEDTECENDEEFDFVGKLLKQLTVENVDYVCKIINIVLSLKPSNIVSKAEHLLQQILSNIEFQTETTSLKDRDVNIDTLLLLKVGDGILNATLKFGEKVSLLFLETPLENILSTTDEALKIFFLTNTVPKLVEGVVGYNILDKIWLYIQSSKPAHKEDSLKVLSCLSNYYLPTPGVDGDSKFISNIIFQYNFWEIILFGIISDDTAIRKIAVYLTKKAIECVMTTKKDVLVKSNNEIIFEWKNKNSKILKIMWDNFFVLIDSLEEKQGNIVLPSLKLFDSVNIGDCWLTSAFNMGLKHENTQVRLKCIEYKIKTKIRNEMEAQTLLEALNDINIFDNNSSYEVLKKQMAELFAHNHSFIQIFETIANIKWSPIPLYHISDILANLRIDLSSICKTDNVSKKLVDILKVPCNSVVLRRAVQINMVYFIKNCYKSVNWKDLTNIYSLTQFKTNYKDNPFISIVKELSLTNEDKINYLNTQNIDLIILYLLNHEEDVNIFVDIINEKLNKLQEGINRQYSDKREYLNNVVFLVDLAAKMKDNNSILNDIHKLISRQNKALLQFILSLFSSEVYLTKDVAVLFEIDNYELDLNAVGDVLLQLYKTAVLFLKDNPEINKAVLSILTIAMLSKSTIIVNSYKHEMLNVKRFIEITLSIKFKDAQNESVGRLKNVFYEKSCEITYILIQEESNINSCLTEVINYIESVLECGGYGCLKWILKIVNKIIGPLTEDEIKFNMTLFINRVWNEIEELKSNNQYSPCIEQFVELITQDGLLKKSMYNNLIISYCHKILEYGPVKTNPLYYLIRKLHSMDVKNYGHLIYVLCEILLYCPVPRKDQRITDNITLEVLQNANYAMDKNRIDIHFNYEIQYLSIATLCSIKEGETLRIISDFITNRIDTTFKNKQRYHGNSHLHRLLQTTLQHNLMVLLKNGALNKVFIWSLDLLVKLPHQPSVRICLEWYIALYFYIEKSELNEEMLQILKLKSTPLTSQFFIFYWLLKHKISSNTYTEQEYDFVLDYLLSHTMGQLFNVRLNAQYLATILYKLANRTTKYQYTIGIIEKTFIESNSEKNFIKLRSDYFTNDFDIVANLTPYFIYYLLPKYCEIENNETNDLKFINNTMDGINEGISRGAGNDFINEWKDCRKMDSQFIESQIIRSVESRMTEDLDTMGTIQKKYIPWRNMSDVNVYDVGKKRESPSQLIVVASLIDKLPNLGGMARTSEVFGVQTYVVDSLRHLQDKQFQGLSVSAERWINIEEVRPGRSLKEYLMRKKDEGYAVVAAEQTSTSSKLQAFKFPKKTLLLLGHEKEGVPCDLLPVMDHCVEIPQQGYVRSLNVHVTAAIFVWEYARQNVL